MAAYSGGGSLVWTAMLNCTSFNGSIQSMVAQMGYASAAARGLEATLVGISTIAFAAVVGGIAAIGAAIYVSVKTSSEWQSNMLSLSALLNNFNTGAKGGAVQLTDEYKKLSRQLQELYANIPATMNEIFDATKAFAAAGYMGEQLTKLSKSTLEFSEVTGVTNDKLSTMVIQMAAINGAAVSSAGGIDKFTDSLYSAISAAANIAAITPGELVSGLTSSAGSMKLWGLENDIPGQTALLTTLKQYGLDQGSWKTTLASLMSTPGLAGKSVVSDDLSKALASAGVNLPSSVTTQTGVYKSGDKKDQAKYTTEKMQYTSADIAAAVMGISPEQFKQDIDKDTVTTVFNLIDKINKLPIAGLDKANLESQVFGTRAQREAGKLDTSSLEYYRNILAQVREEYERGQLASEQYQTKMAGLDAQWQVMSNRANLVKILLGDMFMGSVTSGVKSFSDSIKNVVDWLYKVKEAATMPDGSINSWRAITIIIDDIENKISKVDLKKALEVGGAIVGLTLMKNGVLDIATAAGKAAIKLAEMAGINLMATLAPVVGFVGTLGAIAVGAGLVAVGLGAIGYSLNPEKFTYFNTVASEALQGIQTVATAVIADLAAGDWGKAAEDLKTGFNGAVDFIRDINWTELGSEIVTMIGDGASAIISTAVDIGTWLYDNLNRWVTGGGPESLGKSIGNTIIGAITYIFGGDTSIWEKIENMFGTIASWTQLGINIALGFAKGLYESAVPYFDRLYNVVLETFASIGSTAMGVSIDIENAFIGMVKSIATSVASLVGLGDEVSAALNPSSSTTQSSKTQGTGTINYASGSTSENKLYLFDGVVYNDLLEAEAAASAKYSGGYSLGYGVSSLGTNIGTNTTAITGLTSVVSVLSDDMSSLSDQDKAMLSYLKGSSGSSSTETGSGFETSNGLVGSGNKTPDLGDTSVESDVSLSDSVTKSIDDGIKNSSVLSTIKNILTLTEVSETDKKKAMDNIYDGIITAGGGLRTVVDYMHNSVIDQANASSQISKIQMDEMDATADANLSALLEKIDTSTQTNIDKENEASNALWEKFNGVADALKTAPSDLEAVWNTIESKSYAMSDYAKTALTLGAEVSSNFLTSAGNAVSIGLDKSGREIAVIGTVAKQQWLDAGNTIVQDGKSAGTNFKSDVNESGVTWKRISFNSGSDISAGGTSAKSDMVSGGNSIASACATGASNLTFAFKQIENYTASIGTDTSSITKFLASLKGGSSSTSTTGTQTINATATTADINGNFTDLTCTGETVLVNGLKYTPPGSTESVYLNPLTYLSTVDSATGETSGGIGLATVTQAASGLTTATKSLSTNTVNLGKTVVTSTTKIDKSSDKLSEVGNTNAALSLAASQYSNAVTVQNGVAVIGYTDYASASTRATSDTVSSQTIDTTNSVASININAANVQSSTLIGASDATKANILSASDNFYGKVGTVSGEFLSNGTSVNDSLASNATSLSNVSNSLSSLASQIASISISSGGSGGYYGSSWSSGSSSSTYSSYLSSLPGSSLSGLSVGAGSGYTISYRGYGVGAKGADIKSPMALMAGEKGEELLLPNHLTKLFLALAEMGFANMNGSSSGPTTIILEIDGEEITRVVSDRMTGNMRLRGIKTH